MIININYYTIVLIVINIIYYTYCKTKKDEIVKLTKGNTTILVGVLKGDIDIIRKGINEKGSLNSILTSFTGELILNLGVTYIDFPVAPTSHLAFYQASKQHVDVAFFLHNMGIDSNNFILSNDLPIVHISDYLITNKYSYVSSYLTSYQSSNVSTNSFTNSAVSRGYPPGLLYCLGFGRLPTNNHAAFIQRLFLSIPSKAFNLTNIYLWIALTRNPPLTHIALFNGFFDGLYVLNQYLDLNNERDDMNISSIHLSIWLDDLYSFIYLYTRDNTQLLQSDSQNRLPLHYASMKQNADAIDLILSNLTNPSYSSIYRSMFSQQDRFGYTALDLAMKSPICLLCLNSLVKAFNYLQLLLPNQSTSPLVSYIESVHKDELTINTNSDASIFYINYYITGRPVLITGQLTSHQTIWLFVTLEEFIEEFGSLSISFGERLYSVSNYTWNLKLTETITIKTYIERYLNSNTTERLINEFVGHAYDINLYEYLSIPSIFRICYNFQSIYSTNSSLYHAYNMFIGQKDSSIPMQAHKLSSTWHLLLYGKIVWYIFTSNVINRYYDVLIYDRLDPINRVIKASDIVNQILPNHPNISFNKIIQSPGDVVFIPHGYYYITIHLLDSISISNHFCTIERTDGYITQLGKVIYGGLDSFRGQGHPLTYKQESILSNHNIKSNRGKLPIFGEIPVY